MDDFKYPLFIILIAFCFIVGPLVILWLWAVTVYQIPWFLVYLVMFSPVFVLAIPCYIIERRDRETVKDTAPHREFNQEIAIAEYVEMMSQIKKRVS